MGIEGVDTSYEELRRRNIKRNHSMMRSLGLCAPSVYLESKSSPKYRVCKNVIQEGIELRRSARIAGKLQSTLSPQELSITEIALLSRAASNREGVGRKSLTHGKCAEDSKSTSEKVLLSTMEKKDVDDMENVFYSSDSSESEYQVEFNMNGDNDDLFQKTGEGSACAVEVGQATTTAVCLDSLKTMTPVAFGTQFQEVVIHALMQATSSLISPSPNMQIPGDFALESVVVSEGQRTPTSTWREGTFNMATVKRKRMPLMTKTSAGEESDSQDDFLVPENESLQQRTLRTRRLNRSRAKKAKDLTNNRKAMKKVPYVIHVDGTGRAKGIHKHLWRAAVRGQCGRLDPTMDNINYHPKHVVDSIWHALEKEWEFEGFAHRASEMFERSATKFMRNRKMQLKNKCKKNLHGPKPNDVNDVHWSKIVDLTKESLKQPQSRVFTKNSPAGSQTVLEARGKTNESPVQVQVTGKEREGRIMSSYPIASDSISIDKEKVDAKIESLRTELLRLENSRKFPISYVEEHDQNRVENKGKTGFTSVVHEDLSGLKENMEPPIVNAQVSSQVSPGTTSKKRDEEVQWNASYARGSKTSTAGVQGSGSTESHGQVNFTSTQMECGDLVLLLAFNGGMREEIGKGILMGLADSKYCRKVIPKGWHLVKVYTYTARGALEVCPTPAGWAEQVKQKTIKDAEGRNIVWPDDLLRM